MILFQFFDRKFACMLGNISLMAIGATILINITENEIRKRSTIAEMRKTVAAPEISIQGRKEFVQRGFGIGLGLTLLVSGIVRQATLERLDVVKWFVTNRNKSLFGSSCCSPLLHLVGYPIIVEWFVPMFKINDDDDVDDNVNASGDDDDELDVDFSIPYIIRPMEDISIGAERLTFGSVNSIIIRNDIMLTLQEVIASTNEYGASGHGLEGTEHTYNGGNGNHSHNRHLIATPSLELDELDAPTNTDDIVSFSPQ